jgi:hypothetical protein
MCVLCHIKAQNKSVLVAAADVPATSPPPKVTKQDNRFSHSENIFLEKTLFFENIKAFTCFYEKCVRLDTFLKTG